MWVYKHRKGGLYLTFGTFTHTETGELMVAYVSLAVLHPTRTGLQRPKLWVRPAAMFHDGRFKRLTLRGWT